MDVDRLVAAGQANRQSDAASSRTSADLAAFLLAWESCELTPYADAAGKWTVGIGHLLLPGEPREPITLERAHELFSDDLARTAGQVAAIATTPLEQYRFDALCSFSFNLGAGALHDSTLLRLVNMRQFEAAGYEFPKWNKARVDGVLQPVVGLIRRRAAERAMFEAGDYSGRP